MYNNFLFRKVTPKKLFPKNFFQILQDFDAIMYLLEPNGGGGVSSVGLFYCLILSGLYRLHWRQISAEYGARQIFVVNLMMPNRQERVTLNLRIT
jgi:hypothetical protein